MTGRDSYQVADGIARLCEYMYRKGVADAASFGDTDQIRAVAEREDNNTTYQFLIDEGGKPLPYRYYQDILTMACSRLTIYHMRNFFIGQIGRDALKENICTLCDVVYRKGLIDGLNYSKPDAVLYLRDIGTGRTHVRGEKKIPMKMLDWLTELKYMASKIFYAQKELGIKTSMLNVADLIGDAQVYFKNKNNLCRTGLS